MGLSATNIHTHAEVHSDASLSPADFTTQPWHVAYMAALFETNRNQMVNRITHAKHLILRRERELFAGPGDRAEKNALNRALHALHALRTCLGLQCVR